MMGFDDDFGNFGLFGGQKNNVSQYPDLHSILRQYFFAFDFGEIQHG
jgi:hypothetical protein